MQSIPLAVLKRDVDDVTIIGDDYCMQSIPLAVLKHFVLPTLIPPFHIACNPYRLRYFFIFSAVFSNVRFFYGIMELLEDSF